MIRLSLAVLLAACASLTACASIERQGSESVRLDEVTDRQVLMMLREPPRYYRPEDRYGGRYGAGDRLASRRAAQSIAREYGVALSSDWPMPVLGIECYVLEISSDESPFVVSERLAKDPRVESAQPMQRFTTLQGNDPMRPLQPLARAWRLGEIHAHVTGKGVLIAEIDSGVDVAHPDLRDRVALQSNFVDAKQRVAELHGTAVAGIIVASPANRLGIIGVAPGARLIALRACWEGTRSGDGMCSTFTLAKALQFALERKVQVINMSLGGPSDRLLERLIDVALSRGVTVVAAFDERAADGGFPASYPGVFAVASVPQQLGDGKVLIAPGRDIPTTVPGNRWDIVTGSSFAAAHVSGLVALIRESAPTIDASAMLNALGASTANRKQGGTNMIEPCMAVRRASSVCFCDCKNLTSIQSPRP